jgi:hypothetical protein
MKFILRAWIVFILGALPMALLSSCSKSTDPVTTSTTTDSTYLIKHSMFQKDGQPSINGWTLVPAELAEDTALFTNPTRFFETDVPPGLTGWSFKLHTADVLTEHNQLTQSFTNLKSGVYSLTTWLRYKYILMPGTFPEGWISIIKSSGGVTEVKKLYPPDSTRWIEQTLLDTLSLLPTDTVTVLLSGGAKDGGPNAHGNPVNVDDISFRKLP